jgi:hypothetical protein
VEFEIKTHQLILRFIYTEALVSRLIGWRTDSLWCHTEALSRDGQHWIGAHAATGVEARPLNWCEPTRERQYSIPVTEVAYEAAMAWLDAKVGMPYNYADIVGMTIHRRIGASEHEIICSALMTEFLMASGHYPVNSLESFAYLITPETLHLSSFFLNKCIYPRKEIAEESQSEPKEIHSVQ